jgi:Tol biopolymer transport system component
MNADGSGQRSLTHYVERVAGPAWSLDGRKLAFTSKLANFPDSAGRSTS